MPQVKRIRLNQEYRNKIGVKIEDRLQMEDTVEKERYTQLREQIKPLQDKTWDLMYKIGRENYPQEDVDMAWHLQKKYANVNTIAPDSCFHVAYETVRTEDKTDYNGNVVEKKGSPMNVEEHFDFKVNGSVESGSNAMRSGTAFAYAYFRDELKAQPECNPDINILMKGKDSNNPYQRKITEANDKYLGTGHSDSSNHTSYQKEWDKDYSMDLIGREYCRDRQLMTTKENYDTLIFWKNQKAQFVIAHEQWVQSIQNQMKEIKMGLRGYKYLDEAMELSKELGIEINELEIVNTSSTGLTIFNPKNLADRIKGMKNKVKQTKEEKILARVEYERQANSLN
tara:strand:- start:40 stop:1059 length:1020 start_codon:yes stop_codon:yes gene_type:complete